MKYFDNIKLEGEPVLAARGRCCELRLGIRRSFSKLTANYSARWTGVLSPSETADYIVGFTGQDGYRLWIDGELLVEDWTTHRPSTTLTKPIHLEKSVRGIKIEYFQTVRSRKRSWFGAYPAVKKMKL